MVFLVGAIKKSLSLLKCQNKGNIIGTPWKLQKGWGRGAGRQHSCPASLEDVAHNQSPYVWLQTREQNGQNDAENSGDFVPSQQRQGALKLASITYILCHSFPKYSFRELATRVFLLNTLKNLVSKRAFVPWWLWVYCHSEFSPICFNR